MATTSRKPQSQQEPDSSQESENRPVVSFGPYPASSGMIEVAVWRKMIQTQDNGERATYSVSFQRSYHDEDGWKNTKTLFGHDIPVLLLALQKAYDWIVSNSQRSS